MSGEPIGWAADGRGTTGGDGGSVHVVSDESDLVTILKTEGAKVIQVKGTIQLSSDLRLSSNTSLVGIGSEARLTGGGLHVRKVQNVIVRNLTIDHASDAVNIEESDHIWIDHCDLSDCRDGLVDIKRGSDFITVSWNHFHDHRKTCLLGHSDKDGIREIDRGHLRVTYHHNFFDGTETRHPRVRFANGVHVFNNYFHKNVYGVASVMDAGVLVEGNVFEEVPSPTLTAYGDSPDPGRLVARDNLLIGSGELQTRGEIDESVLTYSYRLDPTEQIREKVRSAAGVSSRTAPPIEPQAR